MVVSGVLGLKGCNVHKAQTADDCLSLLNQFEEKADVVLIKDAFAIDNNLRLVREIRRKNENLTSCILVDFLDGVTKARGSTRS